MTPREPFTPTKLRNVGHPEHPIPTGAFLVTRGGSAYRVDRGDRATLHCTRWPRDEVPADALVIEWHWTERVRSPRG